MKTLKENIAILIDAQLFADGDNRNLDDGRHSMEDIYNAYNIIKDYKKTCIVCGTEIINKQHQ